MLLSSYTYNHLNLPVDIRFGNGQRQTICYDGGGRNSYDFGARILSSGAWTTPDPLAEKFYPLSPYTFCASDPINHVDRDGKVILFINGLHAGDGGKSQYWEGIDQQIKNQLNDNKALYYDGALGGIYGPNINLSSSVRQLFGVFNGFREAEKISSNLKKGETIKIVTHSMGAAYAKGFISGLKIYSSKNNLDLNSKIKLELDLAPYQADDQEAHEDVRTVTIQHAADGIALPVKMPNADNRVTHKDVKRSLSNALKEHSIKSFIDDINNLKDLLKERNK